MPVLKKTDQFLAVFLLALLSFAALYVFRSVDDNRLTSWRWVFEVASAGKVYILMVFSLAGAIFASRYPMPGPTGLFFISFILSVIFWREPEVIVDSSRYFTQAKHLELYGIGYFLREWGRAIGAWTDLPLMPFLYGLIFKLIGESRIYVQLLTSSMFSLTAALTALIGRELYDEETGRAGGMLLLAIPYLYTQAPLMLTDVPLMFFLALSIYTFIRALRRGGPMTVFSALSIFLGVLCKYSLWPLLSVLAVVLIIGSREAGIREAFKRAGAVVSVAGLLCGIALIYKYDVLESQLRLLSVYQGPGLRRWTEGYASTFLFQMHPFIAAGALYSIYEAIKKKDLRYSAVLWPVLLMALFGIRRIRYTIPLFPLIALMSSYGLRRIADEEVRRFIVLAAASSAIVIAVFAYLPFLESMSVASIRDAGRFLDSIDAENIQVFTLPSRSDVNPAVAVPLLDFYTHKKISYDYDPDGLKLPERVKTSPLRFTWEYRNPEYYKEGIGRPGAAVVISDRPVESLPDDVRQLTGDFEQREIFSTMERVFRYRASVTVFYDEG